MNPYTALPFSAVIDFPPGDLTGALAGLAACIAGALVLSISVLLLSRRES